MTRVARRIAGVAGLLVMAACTSSDHTPDHDLRAYIDTLSATDSHAYPMAVVAAGAPADSEYDALPLDDMMRADDIDASRARQLARMVLHDNALTAYTLGAP